MILHVAALAALSAAPAEAPLSVRFCPLEKSILEADLVVTGRIAAIRTPREESEGGWTSAGEYELEVERVFDGRAEPGDRLVVSGCADWTCEERSVEYAEDQRLFLLLERKGKSLQPVFGFQSEFIVEDGEVRQADRPAGFGWTDGVFDGLPDILAFASLSKEEQPAAWAQLLRHPNPEVRQFGLRRFHEIHFTFDELLDGVKPHPYAEIEADVLASLFDGAVALIPEDAAKRSVAVRALIYLWAHVLDDRPRGLRKLVNASRLEAIERLGVVQPGTPELHRDKSFNMRASLGAMDALPQLIDVLRSEDHDKHYKALSALEMLAKTVDLRRRSVLDLIADHPEGTRCEASLGRTSVTLVEASGLEASFRGEGLGLREVMAAFRAWWPSHRAELDD